MFWAGLGIFNALSSSLGLPNFTQIAPTSVELWHHIDDGGRNIAVLLPIFLVTSLI